MSARHTRHGFTLLEVLVAVTILGLVVSTVIGAFQGGLFSYKRGSARLALLCEARGGLHLLGEDVRAMLPVRRPGVEFSAEHLSFLKTMREDGRDVLARVTYRIRQDTITRRVQPVGSPRVAEPVVVVRHVKDAGFLYPAGGEEAVPPVLRVALRLDSGEDDKTVITAFHLPQAVPPGMVEKKDEGDAAPGPEDDEPDEETDGETDGE